MRLKFYGLVALTLILAGFGLTACTNLLNIPSGAVQAPGATPTVCSNGCCIPGPNFVKQWGTVDGAWGIAVSPLTGNVYVTENNYWKAKPLNGGGNAPKPVDRVSASTIGGGFVEEFDPNGKFITSWSNSTYEPMAITVDPANGNVFVGDNSGGGLREYTANGQFVNNWIYITWQGSNYYLYDVYDVKFLGNGNLVLTNYYNTFEMTPNGTVVGMVRYTYPYAFASDKVGNIFGFDWDSRTIQEYSATGNYISDLTSDGFGCDQTYAVYEMAVDNSGKLYAADEYNGWVDVFSPTQQFLGTWTPPSYPWGIAISQGGKVYVSSGYNYVVQEFQQ